jgi:hypothetical protein
VTDYDYQSRDDAVQTESKGPLGGFSLQTAASVLLIAVIAAVLWLFLGPLPDQEPPLPTATPTRSALAARSTGTPAAQRTAVSIGGTPIAGLGPSAMPNAPAPSTTGGVAATGLQDGGFVQVGGTDGFGIRYRFGPGTDFATIRIVNDGEVLQIDGAPEQAEGFFWYRLRDAAGNVGWAAAEYLSPTAQPASWNPPQASPTFPIASGTPAP